MKALLLSALLLLAISPKEPSVPILPPIAEFNCLVKNVYYEARGEPKDGKQAVASVTLNRADYIGSLCKTVYQPKQFSWTKRPSKVKGTDQEWLASAEAAAAAVKGRNTKATHYHTLKVKPVWRKKLKKVAVIGNHVFYAKNV